MILKTTAVVLRCWPYANTSRIVVWFSREHGKLAVLIKGSQRPKSFFLGQYDLFYTCELLFYARAAGRLHIARECSPLNPRTPLRTDWRACAAASYFAGLLDQITPYDSPQPELFDLLEQGLDGLAGAAPLPAFVAWWELRLLAGLGLAPRLDRCLACKAEWRPGAQTLRLACARGGVLCAECAHAERHGVLSVSPGALAWLQGCQQAAAVAESGPQPDPSGRLLAEALRLTGAFLGYHLDLPLPARQAALAVMATPLRAAR